MNVTMSTQASIMIVDDEQIVAKDLELSLKRWGYNVSGIATDVEEALSLTTVTHPDLVLMDVRLRGQKDGIDAARAIREQSGTPVLYLTAYADEETLNRARDTEPYGYLVKPFQDDELHAAVEMALEKHRRDMARGSAAVRREAVLRAALDAIVVMDDEGRILELNEAAEKLFRLEPRQAVGRLFASHFAPDLSENRDYVRVFQALATPAGALPGQRIDMTGVRSDGSTFPAELAMVRTETQGRSVFVAFVRDNTERKRSEDEMNRFLSSLLRSSGRKKPFPEFIPICAACSKARDENGEWMRIEAYLQEHLEISFTHGYCRECAARLLASCARGNESPNE